MEFKDYFSGHASDYARYRPDYPASLFNYLATLTLEHNLAWDCATGNGQAAIALATYYKKIVATDASQQQIQAAQPHPQIHYQVMSAEKTNFVNQSVDLITVAQALHWFHLNEFYMEANRILKPTGILAAWTYTLLEIENSTINKLFQQLYWDITRPHWAAERRWIDEEYKTIPFPFTQIEAPMFYMEKNWDLKQVLGYLNTWSGLKNYQAKHGNNPIDLILPALQQAWQDPNQTYLIRWPVFLLIGKPNSSEQRSLPIAPL